MQPKFSLVTAVAGLALFAAIVWADVFIDTLPNWPHTPPTVAQVRLDPIELDSSGLAPLRLAGAWQLTATGRPIAGVSGLAVDGEELVAITDTGVIARLPKALRRRMPVRVLDLPAVPGDPRATYNRDSEAIVRDPGGRGWWVAFERRDQLWLFDREFGRALGRTAIPDSGFTTNGGIEGLAAQGRAILAFPEGGGAALRLASGRWSEMSLDRRAPVSDATAIDASHILLVERRVTLLGLRNALVLVQARGGALRTLWRRPIPVSWRDNVEGIAAERTASGHRLWLATDDNFHPRLRTLLIVIDVPAAALPKAG